MEAWISFLLGLALGTFAGVMLMAVVASGSDKRGQEGGDFLSEPVELERRSMVRWKGLKVLP